MFALVVFVLVFQYLTNRLAGKNVSEITYLCRVGRKTTTQSIVIIPSLHRDVRNTQICDFRIFRLVLSFPHISAKCACRIFFRIFWPFCCKEY